MPHADAEEQPSAANSRRGTPQRRAILRAFREMGRPLCPREVLDAARAEVPSLGLATVYRNLKSLVDDGTLATVELPGATGHYELAGKGHHHYFRCRSCDRVFDVEGCAAQLEELTPRGFQLEAHEIVLYGRCDACCTPS